MGLKVYGLKAFKDELRGIIRDVRVTWLLEELGLPYERIVMDPMKDENKTSAYLALNPTGKVPTLVDNGFAIFESSAICEYLAQKNGRFLPPAGSAEYYEAKQWAAYVLTNLDAQTGAIFRSDFFLEQNETTQWFRQNAMALVQRFLAPLNDRLATRPYLMGEFSICDVFLGTSLAYIQHTNLLVDFPHVERFLKACTSRPAYIKASSENGREHRAAPLESVVHS